MLQMNHIYLITKRDIKLAFGDLMQIANPIIFFLCTICMVPFAMGHDTEFLKSIWPGICIISMFFAAMLNINYIFTQDEQDGSLDVMIATYIAPSSIIISKLLVSLLISWLPLITISVVTEFIIGMNLNEIIIFSIGMILAAPFAACIIILSCLLTINQKASNLIVPLITIPFIIIIPIYVISAIESLAGGSNLFEAINIYVIFIGMILIFLPTTCLLAGSMIKNQNNLK